MLLQKNNKNKRSTTNSVQFQHPGSYEWRTPSKVNSLYHPLSHMDTYVCINIGPDTLNSSRMHLEQSLKNIILWYRSKPENKASYHIHLIMLHVKGTWNKTKHFLKWGQGHNHIKLYKPKLWFQFCHLLINIGKKKNTTQLWFF